jgi:hypothetical protein
MTTRTYSTGERLAAVAILLAALAGVGAAVAPAAIGDYISTEDEIEGLRTRFAELVRRERDLGALEARRDALRQSDPQKYGLLVADTLELARADMQSALQNYATETGAAIAQFRAVDTEDPHQAAAAVDLQIPMDALPQLLTRIAGSEPLLFIDSIDIRANIRRRNVDGPETLAVSLALSSYVSIPGEKQKP